MRSLIVGVSLFFIFQLGCSKKDEPRVINFREVVFDQIPADIKIPSKAWDLIEKAGAGTEGACLGCLVANKEVAFSEISVLLIDKNPGVVDGEAVRINLPKGGGTIDLDQFITSKKGSFFVKFEFAPFARAIDKRVLFVSGAKKRKIGDLNLGAGCNQFFDISNRYFHEMAGNGIKVNTTQERYISVIGGTFLFTSKQENRNDVAQVTFTHSKHIGLFCDSGESK